MEEDILGNLDEQVPQPDQNPDFIQEFIERKKLQNKILQELIDKLYHSEPGDKSEPNQIIQ